MLLPLLVLLFDFDHRGLGSAVLRLCVGRLYLVCEVRVVLLCSVSRIPFSSLRLAMANSSETDDIGCDVEV